MNIVKTLIQNIHPDPVEHQMHGEVTFYLSGGLGPHRKIASYECICAIPKGDTPNERLALIKQGLRNDALQQACHMSEIQSGAETLVFLIQRDQAAV